MEQSYLSRLTFDPHLLKGPVASYLKNIRLTILLVASIVFLGVVSFFNLPRRLNPEVNIPIVTVVTVLPGAGPEDVESLVTIPLENAIQSLGGIDRIQSTSRDNVSAISVQFVSGTDRDRAKDQVQSQVETVSLPSDARDPVVTALDFENTPIWQVAISTTEDIGSLQMFAKALQKKLEDDPKIERVTIVGLEEREIVVAMNQEKVAELGFNPLIVAQAIRSGIASYPSGIVETTKHAFSFTVQPTIQSLEDIRNIRLSIQGSFVSLGDIAIVSERSKPKQRVAYIGKKGEEGKEAITLSIFKTKNATITEAANRAKDIVDKEINAYGTRFQAKTIVNTADQISEQFTDLLGEFRSTLLLLFGSLLVFLGIRQAVIASFTIPLTFLSSFALMQYVGMSINFLTLFALLLTLGLLVDDTIVIISAMTAYYRTKKFTPLETGLLVWRDTIVPIWSTTITTIWSFVPLLLATGIIGEFIKPIPVVVTITMISSTAIAVLVTLPVMMVILKPTIPRRVIILGKVIGFVALLGILFAFFRENALFLFIAIIYFVWIFIVYRIVLSIRNKQYARIPIIATIVSRTKIYADTSIISLSRLASWYKKVLARVISSKQNRRRVVIAIVAYASVGFLLLPLGFVRNEFFPKTDSDRVYIELSLPQGSTLEQTYREMMRIFQSIKETPEAEFVTAELGRRAPLGGGNQDAQESNVALFTLRIDEKKFSSIKLAEKLRETFSDNPAISVIEVSGGPPAGSDLQMTISGDDLSTLSFYGDSLVEYLKNTSGVVNPKLSIQEGTSALVFKPNPDLVARAGLSLESVGFWTRLYGSGFSLGEANVEKDGNDKTPIRFSFDNGSPDAESLGKLSIPTQRGTIPLLSLGSLELQTNPTKITRENGRRTIVVTADVLPGYSVSSINRSFESYANELNLPSGYSWKTGGVNEENARSVRSILQAMGIAFILILVTMVIQFGSFRQAIIVLLVIPLAVSSIFYAFAITGTPLSFPALIGVLSLFGIIVKNSMFIVDKINLNQKEGMSFEEAIIDAGESRLEPILLTKLTTVLGLIPITLSDPLWRGLGGSIISGLLIASTIMLLFIPVVYYQWMKPSRA